VHAALSSTTLTYFADLSPYSYRHGQRDPAINVGWLDGERTFEVDEPSEPLLDALWRFVCAPVNQSRGLHQCELCPRDRVREVQRRVRDPEDASHKIPMGKLPWPTDARRRSNDAEHNGEQRLIGSAEIRNFGTDGTIYAAPTLIYHYVAQHQYKPPVGFVGALLDGPNPRAAPTWRRFCVTRSTQPS
jgi:hypothetical protein